MYTLDANVFARTVQANQPTYADYEALITHLSTTGIPIITPLIVLAEVAAAARRETGDAIRARVFADIVRGLPTLQLVAVDVALARAAADFAADLALRGMDAIYVAVAQRFGTTLVTLDDEPRRRAGHIIPIRTPHEALADLNATP